MFLLFNSPRTNPQPPKAGGKPFTDGFVSGDWVLGCQSLLSAVLKWGCHLGSRRGQPASHAASKGPRRVRTPPPGLHNACPKPQSRLLRSPPFSTDVSGLCRSQTPHRIGPVVRQQATADARPAADGCLVQGRAPVGGKGRTRARASERPAQRQRGRRRTRCPCPGAARTFLSALPVLPSGPRALRLTGGWGATPRFSPGGSGRSRSEPQAAPGVRSRAPLVFPGGCHFTDWEESENSTCASPSGLSPPDPVPAPVQ